MVFRKAQPSQTTSDLDARDRRRRGRGPDDAMADQAAWDPADPYAGGAPTAASGAPGVPSRPGPYDSSEVEHGSDPAAAGRDDFGALQIPRMAGVEVKVGINQASQVDAVFLVQGASALELRAFAAPKSRGLWDEDRRSVSADVTRAGGVVTEGEGPFGRELKVIMPGRTPDGQPVNKTLRFVGVDGPRWGLRGTLHGQAASDPAAAGPLLSAMSAIVVVRGKSPMAPGEMIPLRDPHAARPA
ncbi:DUF3710 domain-containing protein [Actinopolymorpha sp. B17G11]|uniref:DUF3710 domain-containing protein n=1 Tax=unclassified Actinopolymorpha TaxID=2627063 RepID=UPI0032D92C4F